jgi:hypothetical protein
VVSVVWLVWDSAFSLLLVAAFLSFLWLFATSIALIRMRRPAQGFPKPRAPG